MVTGAQPPVPGTGSEPFEMVLAGLARQVEALRRTADTTAEQVAVVEPRVDELARLTERIAANLAALASRVRPAPAPSWLLAPDSTDEVETLLDELRGWLFRVFLRYSDAATALPACWLRHPDIVEELLWLMHAWCAAYQGETASVAGAADWHDRYRPGVVRRIRTLGACSPEKHMTRPEWDQIPTGAVEVPREDEAAVLARWWATGRDDPAPEPGTTEIGARSDGAQR